MIFNSSVHLVDVDTCRPEKCPGCDPQRDCVVAAVSNKETGVGPFLYVNKFGGDLDMWATGITLSNWIEVGEHPTSILCLGDFVLITSNVAAGVYYSDDLGTTLVEHVEAAWSDGPNSTDAIDQSFIVLVADAGHIWGSYDAARSWEILDDAHATTKKLLRVMIARDNPQVIYAIGEDNTVVKTENGGQNWFALVGPATVSEDLTALWVKDQFHVLVIDDNAVVWETSDGAASWLQQDALPGLTAEKNQVGNDMVGCGCDGLWAIVGETGGEGHTFNLVYRNVDGGASGKWYVPENVPSPYYEPLGIACCDINRAIVVGGYGESGNVLLVA